MCPERRDFHDGLDGYGEWSMFFKMNPKTMKTSFSLFLGNFLNSA